MGRYARRTRVKSRETCPWCGLAYERFRSPSVPSFAEAKAQVMVTAQAAVAEGRFEHTARVWSVLGYMHGAKQTAWRSEHLEWCKREHEAKMREEVDDGEPPF